jgi:hypothetical protein
VEQAIPSTPVENMAITVSLSASIQAQDVVTNNLLLNKTLAAFSYLGSVSTFAESILVGTTPVVIGLPISPTEVVYVRNTHATQLLTVTWTPNGGSSAVVLTLQPNSYILFGEVNATSGITALTLTGSASNTSCEYFLAG